MRTRLLLCLLACTSLALAQNAAWHSLFDGESLSGWQANESPGSWSVQDGAIVAHGPRSHLFYVGEVNGHSFKNFEFSAEVLTTLGSNSGIYIHTKLAPDPWPTTGYECQVVNSTRPPAKPGDYVERKMTGSIYAVRNTWRTPARDNEWFEYRIKVMGRTIQTFINGELICQYTEGGQHWRAPDKKLRRLSAGTFALQGHDPDSVVHYRNLRVRILPDNAASLETPLQDLELDELIAQLSDRNYPLIDFGITAKSVAQETAQLEAARRLGVTLSYSIGDAAKLDQLASRGTLALFNDRTAPPTVAQLKAAKAAGMRIAFSSGGTTRLAPERLKARLQAILDADLSWNDLWAP
ncbi:3-keto-disaccharide hydrolase [Actomonas aquatica]|uniref:DUF1080 domain-containing protein n=1 Tax=Actomonas aquatica TaxID=2866162 RepID=A0ABZ1C992_9BACT|nr:DUF1080 domain-containing protein [Opitutus sp. WL0086]WRQ88036.1 DUF1080 domain-containing protein [Opitutus sp. WL0086]